MNNDIICANGYQFFYDGKGNLKAVSKKNGEVTDASITAYPTGSSHITPDGQREINEAKRRKQENYYRRLANNPLGSFFFTKVDEEFEGLSPQTVARLVYLNTYADYNTNKLLHSKIKGEHPIFRNELGDVLHLSQSAAKAFWREVHPRYLTTNDNGELFTSADVFHRGKLMKEKGTYIDIQKFYIRGIRNVYNATEPTKHKHLGYIFMMLPYINFEYNILCKNPRETDVSKIEPLTMIEFCNLIGFDKSHIDRLCKIYDKLKFKVDEQREELFCLTVNSYRQNKGIFVNPRIIYNGSNYIKVEGLGIYFR